MNWQHMNAQPRRPASALGVIPTSPGVYALYRDGAQDYVGKAERRGLRRRIGDHTKRSSASMTKSAMRRNVAEHLGIATPADIYNKQYVLTADEANRVGDWISEGEFAWIECSTPAEAEALENALERSSTCRSSTRRDRVCVRAGVSFRSDAHGGTPLSKPRGGQHGGQRWSAKRSA